MNLDFNQTAISDAADAFESGSVSFLNGVATSNNYNQIITLICSRYLIWLLLAFAVFVAVNWSSFQRLLTSVLVGMGGKLTVNAFVHRLRPYMLMNNIKTLDSSEMGLLDSWGSSMPSGHTVAAFAAAASLLFAANKTINQRRGMLSRSEKAQTTIHPIIALTAASLVAIARVAHGFHYPSDIAAGMGIGVASAFVVHKFSK